jgi:hypothetical protein
MPSKLALSLALLASAAFAQPKYEDILKNLKFRSIGPASMGGRTDDFATFSDPCGWDDGDSIFGSALSSVVTGSVRASTESDMATMRPSDCRGQARFPFPIDGSSKTLSPGPHRHRHRHKDWPRRFSSCAR